MKRKDALYKIRSILDNLNGICSHKLISEAVLSELERSGLLPPLIKKLKKYTNEYNGEIGYIESIEDVNEWED